MFTHVKDIIPKILALTVFRYYSTSDSKLNISLASGNIPLGNFSFVWQAILPILAMALILGSGIRGGDRVLEYFLFALFNYFYFIAVINEVCNKNIQLLNLTDHLPSCNIVLQDISGIVFVSINYFFILLILLIFGQLFGLNILIDPILQTFVLYFFLSIIYAIPISLLCLTNGFFNGFHKLFTRLLFFTSSIIIPVPLLPDEFRDIFLINPLVHLNELLRSETSGIYYDYIGYEIVLSWGIVLSALTIPSLYLKHKLITDGVIRKDKNLESDI